MKAVGLPTGHEYMSYVDADFAGEKIVVCRSGYSGEKGYEVIAPAVVAGSVWDALLTAGEQFGVQPCGLGARDTLRTEMGYPLHGQDLSPEITPLMGGAGWAVGWDKPAFWGRDALLAQKAAGPPQVLRGIRASGRGIPRPHMIVSTASGTGLGEITSGTFSPTLRQGIALALLDPSVTIGDEVVVDIRGKSEAFIVTRPPFVRTNVRGDA
jgi:aminomethyltransferase